MNNQSVQNNDLKVIRDMMERSSKFLSLSGLSGILAGIFAILGAAFAWFFILGRGFEISDSYFGDISYKDIESVKKMLVLDASIVLLAALASSVLLSRRKALASSQPLFSRVAARLLTDLSIPLISGGVFSIIFLVRGDSQYIAPSMLVFYGIALVSAARHTFGEIRYLGIMQIIIGIIALLFPGWGLLFWVAGFGLLHIAYGIIIQRKYH